MERRERRQADVHKRLGKVAYGVVLTGFPWTQFAAFSRDCGNQGNPPSERPSLRQSLWASIPKSSQRVPSSESLFCRMSDPTPERMRDFSAIGEPVATGIQIFFMGADETSPYFAS
jgi:hypothetical protein